MNLNIAKHTLESLFLAALRSEVDSQEVYTTLANRVKNAVLKDRLKFLASEEEKHRLVLTNAYKGNFPGKELVIPGKSPVPMPQVNVADENIRISEVLLAAMKAEKAASEFYMEFSKRFDKGTELRKTLEYFAMMEEGHYDILSVERNNSLNFENYDEYWPMMHSGP